MAARENTTFDEDKKLLMCIILNHGINVMEECKKAAARMGPGVNAETLRFDSICTRVNEAVLGKKIEARRQETIHSFYRSVTADLQTLHIDRSSPYICPAFFDYFPFIFVSIQPNSSLRSIRSNTELDRNSTNPTLPIFDLVKYFDQPSIMPPKWSAESDHIILLAVVKQSDTKVPMELFDKIAEKLGDGTSASACYQRYYKLKREAESLLPKPDDATGATSSTTPTATPAKKGTATPVKKATTAATPKKSTGKGRKRKTDDNDDASDADFTTTPSKKNKTIKSTTEDAEDHIAADDDDK